MYDPKPAILEQIELFEKVIPTLQAELDNSRERYANDPAMQELLSELWTGQEAYIESLRTLLKHRKDRIAAL